MDWLHPQYLWALVLVPMAVGLLLWAAWRRTRSLHAMGDPTLVERLSAAVSSRRRRWKGGLVVLGVSLLAIALAGPRVGTQLREVKREGVDLVIALDVSNSMHAEDVAPNRLMRAKNEIKKLISSLEGDRVGLVIFAGDAFIQCPLTNDYSALRLFLDIANSNMIPTQGTNFKAAIDMAIKALDIPSDAGNAAPRSRALLIVSDGENHEADIAGSLQAARRNGVVVFTAGVGETDGVPIPVQRAGQPVGYKRDNQGRVVSTKLEEEALRELASEGAYFRIARTSSSLSQFPAALGRLERTEYAADQFESYEEQYQWPLAMALLLLIVERVVSDRRRRRSSVQTLAPA